MERRRSQDGICSAAVPVAILLIDGLPKKTMPIAKLVKTTSGIAGLFVLTLLIGCGSQGAPCWVSGQVIFDGQPIPDGNLRMDPIEGTLGPGGSSAIKDGKYSIPQASGMLAGKYRVRGSATRATGRMIRVETLDGGAREREEIRQYIPDRYNQNSDVVIELAPGENTYNFDWHSK